MEPPALKDELKSVTGMSGALSVITYGLLRMQMWHVGSLDSVALVSSFRVECQHLKQFRASDQNNPSLQVLLPCLGVELSMALV